MHIISHNLLGNLLDVPLGWEKHKHVLARDSLRKRIEAIKQTHNRVGSSENIYPEVATIAPVSVVHPPFVAVTSGSISLLASQSYKRLYSAHSSVGLWCYA